MTKIYEIRYSKTHQPCDACGSSDALAIYSDGHTHCFSCNKTTYKDGRKQTEVDHDDMDDINVTNVFSDWRGVDASTMKKYSVTTQIDNTTSKPVSIFFPYSDEAGKTRRLDSKDFRTSGKFKEAPKLFGKSLFSAGSSKYITLTEGELDAMSVYQMLGSKYPVVSVSSGASARRDCEDNYEYLNSFERIYLAFDNDSVGQTAVKQVASLFDVNKVYHVIMDKYKDANEYLTNNEDANFVKLWWNARPIRPQGIIADMADIREILGKQNTQPIATFPFATLNEKSFGIFSGKFYLFTALEKVGKTEIMRAIEHHLLKTTDENIAIIHLEEQEKRSIQGLLSYEFNVPVHRPDCTLTTEEQAAAYEKMVKRDGRLHFYKHFGSDDPAVIVDIIRYLVAKCKCKFVFLDHISMIVSGASDNDRERQMLDRLSTQLVMMTRDLDFSLFVVSHVNDNKQTRGSRYIGKVADLIVHLDRNPEASDPNERDRTKIIIKGNRDFGQSGPAGLLRFDHDTYQIKEETAETVAASTAGVSPF